jgi:hypothetical protein
MTSQTYRPDDDQMAQENGQAAHAGEQFVPEMTWAWRTVSRPARRAGVVCARPGGAGRS